MGYTHAADAHGVAKLQSYQTVLSSKSLHPELFRIEVSSRVERPAYLFSAWVLRGAHVCSFTTTRGVATELVSDSIAAVPSASVIDSFLCAGERDASRQVEGTNIVHMTAAQTEQLPEHLYADTYNELDDMARGSGSLVYRFSDHGGACMSILDIQEYAREIHFQAYHMLAGEGLVLRTQSIFEIRG